MFTGKISKNNEVPICYSLTTSTPIEKNGDIQRSKVFVPKAKTPIPLSDTFRER